MTMLHVSGDLEVEGLPEPPQLEVKLVASGDSAFDCAGLNALIACGYRRIGIDTRSAPLILGSGEIIELDNAWLYPSHTSEADVRLLNKTQLRWGKYISWARVDADSQSCTVATDGRSIAIPPSRENPAIGSTLCIMSDDVLDVVPHIGGGTNRPQELVRVQSIVGNEIFLDRPLEDRYTINVRCTVMADRLRGGGMEGIDFSQSENGVDDLLQGIGVYGADGWRAEHITLANTGALNVYLSDDTLIEDLTINGQQTTRSIYGVASVCNGRFRINGYRGWGCRHMFTTGGYDDGNKNRYGTNPHHVIENFDWVMNETQSGTAVAGAGDTHAEGLGVTFRDGRISYAGNADYTSPVGTLYGIHGRSRRLRIERVKFRGDHSQKCIGVLLDGDRDTIVRDCDFEDLIIGCIVRNVGDKPGTPVCQRTWIQNSRFRNIRNEAILFNGGDGHTVSRCDIDGAGIRTGGYFGSKQSAITFNDYGTVGISNITVRGTTIHAPAAQTPIWVHPSIPSSQQKLVGNIIY